MPLMIDAKGIKYNHNSITVSEIKEMVNYEVLAPEKVPKDWTLEIKTYPWGEKGNYTHFRLHYMDRKDTQLLVGIEQRKDPPNIEWLNSDAKQVKVNGKKGYFEEWGNSGELDKKGEPFLI